MTGDTSDLIERLKEDAERLKVHAICEDIRDAIDHIAALESEIAQLRDGSIKFAIANAKLGARCTELEAALEPFAKEAEAWADMWEDAFTPIIDTNHLCENCGHSNTDEAANFTVGDLRRARSLASKGRAE